MLLPDNQSPPDFAQQEAKRTIPLPGAVGVLRDPRTTSGTPGTKRYDIEQISDLRDITGDGIPDYVFFGGPRNPPGDPQGLKYPFAHGHYRINALRLGVEAGAYGGLVYGFYQLGSFLGGDRDKSREPWRELPLGDRGSGGGDPLLLVIQSIP